MAIFRGKGVVRGRGLERGIVGDWEEEWVWKRRLYMDLRGTSLGEKALGTELYVSVLCKDRLFAVSRSCP